MENECANAHLDVDVSLEAVLCVKADGNGSGSALDLRFTFDSVLDGDRHRVGDQHSKYQRLVHGHRVSGYRSVPETILKLTLPPGAYFIKEM